MIEDHIKKIQEDIERFSELERMQRERHHTELMKAINRGHATYETKVINGMMVNRK